jgi:hypothetical protein
MSGMSRTVLLTIALKNVHFPATADSRKFLPESVINLFQRGICLGISITREVTGTSVIGSIARSCEVRDPAGLFMLSFSDRIL